MNLYKIVNSNNLIILFLNNNLSCALVTRDAATDDFTFLI